MSDSNEVQTRKNEQDLICLISCLVQSRRLDPARFQAMDLDGLWKMGEMHSVTAMLGTVLIPLLEADNRTAEAVRWKKAVNNARWKTVVMDAEKEELYRFLEKEGIWYLPLKGTVMMEYYPVYGIREMADIDILYDVRYDERVRKWFTDRGYKIEMFRQGAHDTFIKAPVYNFEMHRTLFSKELPVWRG